MEDQPDVSAVLSAYNQQGDPTMYEEYYSGLKHFIECSLDCHRAELSQLFYPLFVHMYLELVYNQHENEAKSFFEKYVNLCIYIICIDSYIYIMNTRICNYTNIRLQLRKYFMKERYPGAMRT